MSDPRMPKIAYILPDFEEDATYGGLYVIFEHCNGLIKRGYPVRVFNDSGKDPIYLKLDCHVERHHYDPDVIDNWGPDIIVATHWPTFYMMQRLKSPQENGASLFYLIQSDERHVAKYELMPFCLRTLTEKGREGAPVNKLVVSRYLKNMLLNDFGEESEYVPNGIRIRTVEPLLGRSEKIRVIARYDLSKFRGWDITDEVLKKVTSEVSNLEVHLFEMKKNNPTSYKSIFHEGYTGDKLLSLFKSCDIFLGASDKEGFGYPILEAMSQGACACCTDAGGNMDFCIDGKTALVSKARDVSGLYSNLMRLINDKALRARISEAGRAKAAEFSWEASIDMLENALVSAYSKRRKRVILPAADRRVARRILMIWEKDPFGDIAQWGEFDRAVRNAWQESSELTVLVRTDRHPMKSARSFLRMLFPKDISECVVPVILYNKHLPQLPDKISLLLFRFLAHTMMAFNVLCGTRYVSILRYPQDLPKNT